MDPLPKLLGLLLILQFGDVQGDDPCAIAGGEVVDGKCLTFNEAVADRFDWIESKAECYLKKKGRLAQFVDINAAYEYIKTHHRGKWYAIGATDVDIEGTWKWNDGPSFVPKPWKKGWQSKDARDWLWVSHWGFDDAARDYRGSGYICDICRVLGGTIVAEQCLFFEDVTKTWEEAKRSCEKKGRQLAIPLNPSALKTYHKNTFDDQWRAYWLGGSDRAIEGKENWLWSDGKKFDQRFPWERNQPDNAGGRWGAPDGSGQDCLAVGWKHGFDDKACTEKNRYICAYK